MNFNPLSLYIYIQDIPGSEILWNLWAGIFAFLGGMRAWLHGGSVMAFRVKNYEILGVFI